MTFFANSYLFDENYQHSQVAKYTPNWLGFVACIALTSSNSDLVFTLMTNLLSGAVAAKIDSSQLPSPSLQSHHSYLISWG